MTEKLTFQESGASDDKPRRSLGNRLGWLGFTITFVTVVLAFLALGAAVSMLLRATRRPPIVTPTHGALGVLMVPIISITRLPKFQPNPGIVCEWGVSRETLMFWLGVVLFVIAWAVTLLVWASCALAKEGDEALEELDESLRRLQQVATSVVRTSGRSAELIHRRAQPIRHLLDNIGDDVAQPQRR
jgi:hypothetical protein